MKTHQWWEKLSFGSPNIAVETALPGVSLAQLVPHVLRSSMIKTLEGRDKRVVEGVEPGKKMNVSPHSWTIRRRDVPVKVLTAVSSYKGQFCLFFIERSCCLAADTAPLLLLAGCVATLRHSATVLQLLGLGTKSSCQLCSGGLCLFFVISRRSFKKKKKKQQRPCSKS